MKSTPVILLLSALAFTSLTATASAEGAKPLFEIQADQPAPVQEVLGKCNGLVAALQRCEAAVGAVKDKATADAAADVIRHEMRVVSALRDECLEIFAANPDIFPEESENFAGGLHLSQQAERIGEAIKVAVQPIQEALETLEAAEEPFFGSAKLQAAATLYEDVTEWGMTPEESDTLPGVVEACMEYNAVCMEAWECILSVQDRASADAAAAKLAGLRQKSDAVTDRMKSMLDTLRQDRLPGFFGQVVGFARNNMDEQERARMYEAKNAATDKMGELRAAEPPFYGSKDLEENAGAFVMEPR